MAEQGSARFISALQISDMEGNYTMASESQILAEARRVIDFRYPEGTEFSSAAVSEDYFRVKLAGFEREVFAVAFLNNQHQLLAYRELFHGSINMVDVKPREIVRAALLLNAAAVILGHNHPSFDAVPSAADKQITLRIKNILELVDVRLLDHIIIGGNDVTSMAREGLIGM
ncbi:JAB domain-containing protein [Pantoea cypripedii]|uniref:DNA repair protein RadC n=1 Tax=Pantoea cypripedii TaxID=55209 RepID=A0A1X1EMW5_PANCY|nr:JAB domain-containing protein [Pantoea cypripedii]MBP2199078.1 DNA repair protein RadC [Pantoea cypripedii]ORM90298.1 DNA repair protein RadC [Pantoea cypripedii]